MGKTSLRIMFMNAENLFSPPNQFYGSEYTQNQYDEKINWIGNRIVDGQVHVCALSEIGEDPMTCMNDIMANIHPKDSLKSVWGKFQHFYLADPSSSGTKIRTAVLSRFPLSNEESISVFPDKFQVDIHKPGNGDGNDENWIKIPLSHFSRPIAKATISPPNNATPFNVFVVHLKSKRPKTADHDNKNHAIGLARSAIQRNIEAAALRFYMDKFLPKTYQETNGKVPTILVGDFNDTPTSVPIQNIRGSFDKVPGPSSPWSEIDKQRLLSCGRLHLKKAAYQDKLFSYIYEEQFSLYDQAFVTEHLAGRFRQMEVYNDHVFRHQTIRVDTNEDSQWKSVVSDHGVIVVEFNKMLKQ